MPSNRGNAREVAALVPMTRLLRELGFEVNERTRRAPCLLHSGSNPTAFSWRDDGHWHCFSCGRGGDRIALVRAVRLCRFRQAVEFLAALVGDRFHSGRVSRREIARTRRRRERAERAAWRIVDEVGRLRRYYTDALHRCERLQARIGGQLSRTSLDRERDNAWEQLARFAPVSTYFFAGWNFIWTAKPDALVRFATTFHAERRRFIIEGIAP